MPLTSRAPRLLWAPDQQYQVATDDGSAIALGRYLPRGDTRRTHPVLLVHGLGTNRFDLDFDEKLSLARQLARAGFEAWVLELRGHGLAGDAASSTFDREAEFDVSAALRTILSTGAAGVHWVGHSRGGLLAWAHLAHDPRAPIRSVTALGSPVEFTAQPGLRGFLNSVGPLLKLPVIPLSWARVTSPVGLLPPDPFRQFLLNVDNVDAQVIRQSLAWVTADVPGGVARAFHRWVDSGVMDTDGGRAILPALRDVKIPVLLIAGSADRLAPPVSVFAVQKYLTGPVQTFEAGRVSGLDIDYGHGDLSIGRHAPRDIGARVVEFVIRSDG